MTIDLEADEVKRAPEKAEGAADPAREPGQAGKAEEPAAEAAATEEADIRSADKPEDKTSDTQHETREGEGGAAGDRGESITESERAEPRSGAVGRALAAGVAGGVIALALAGALQWAHVLPVPGARDDAADVAVDSLRQDVEALRGEIGERRETTSEAAVDGAVEQALAEPRQQIAALRQAVSSLQESISSRGAGETTGIEAFDSRIGALESRLAQLSETSGGQAGADGGLAERLAALESGAETLRETASAAKQAGSANAQRLDTLAGRVEALSKQVASQDEGPRLALVVAASALKSAVERGAPFAGELETYSALAPNAPELEPLRQYAETGIPTDAELAEEAPDVASRIAAAASAPPAGAGFLDRLMASARSAVTVRPVGEVAGEAPEAIAARMEAAVLKGDYAQALAEYEALPPKVQEAANGFAERLRARQATDRILEKALSDALKPA